MEKEKSRDRKIKTGMEWMMGIFLLLLGILLSLFILPRIAGNKSVNVTGEERNGDGYGDEDGNNSGTDSKGKALAGKKIVIDPGHGGMDPGKVGVHDELEKQLNLQIAMKLVDCLEAEGAKVICTRTTDTGLYSESDSNKKVADLRQRCRIIEAESPDITISIHQNSYTSEGVRGAQVFYYETSEKSAALASELQKALIAIADPDNKRVQKPNNSYYMLVHSLSPAVIVECGFLSNGEEAIKLGTEEYQQTLAEAITEGIKNYFKL